MTDPILFLSAEQRLRLAKARAPLPEGHKPGTVLVVPATAPTVVLNLSTVGPKRFITFVRQFDPSKHPRGYKGMFIDTPDKRNAGDVPVGSVIATKSGKAFRVEGHGPKGIKVSSVDPDSGEVLSKGTIVANGIQVAVVEGKGAPTATPNQPNAPSAPANPTPAAPSAPAGLQPGSSGPVGDAVPGTIIETRAGKRFEVSKHGKWTTVYPVDSDGNRVGKHTVLPSTTEVTAVTKSQAPPLSTKQVQQVAQAVQKAPAQQAAKPQEILPKVLPNMPKLYSEGVGKNTRIEIHQKATHIWNNKINTSQFEIYRVAPDGTRVLLSGDSTKVGDAKKQARNLAGEHEEISEIREEVAPMVADYPEPGQWLFDGSSIYPVTRVEVYKDRWTGANHAHLRDVYYTDMYGNEQKLPTPYDTNRGSYGFGYGGGRYLSLTKEQFQTLDTSVGGRLSRDKRMAGQHDLSTWAVEFLTGQTSTVGSPPSWDDRQKWITDYWQPLRVKKLDRNVLRAARPAKYSEALSVEWKLDDLTGKTAGEAAKIMKARGYGEITPREKGKLKWVRRDMHRVDLHLSGGKVTSVDERQTESTVGASTEFKKRLQEVLDTGGDVRWLDPNASPFAEERGSHVRQLIYDMALGKQNGVDKQLGRSGRKVKTDAEYRAEIQADPDFAFEKYQGQVDAPTISFTARGSIMDEFWPAAGTMKVQHDPNSRMAGNYWYDFASKKLMIGEDDPKGMGQTPEQAYHGVDDESVATFVSMALQYRGVAQLSKDGPAEVRSTDLVQFAKKLERYVHTVDETKLDAGALGTLHYLRAKKDEQRVHGQAAFDDYEVRLNRIAEALRKADVDKEIEIRRKKEGTVAAATQAGLNTFELPLWDEIDMQEQNLEEIEGLVSAIPQDVKAMVPGFFSGGTLKDGVLYFARGNNQTGTVNPEVEENVVNRLRQAGAELTKNSKNIDPGYRSGSGSIFAGNMLKLEDHVQPPPVEDPVVLDTLEDYMRRNYRPRLGDVDKAWFDKAVDVWKNKEQDTNDHDSMAEAFKAALTETRPTNAANTVSDVMLSTATLRGNAKSTGHVWSAYRAATDDTYAWIENHKSIEPKTRETLHELFEEIVDKVGNNPSGVNPDQFKRDVFGPKAGTILGTWMREGKISPSDPVLQDLTGKLVAHWDSRISRNYEKVTQGNKRVIEYVPHFYEQPDSLSGGAPTNQRGRLTLHGYTHAEAVEKLKELGLVHELEPEVPFKQVMRSSRRYGVVTPLHSDYVSGEFELPTIPAAISHGITEGMMGASSSRTTRIRAVIESGGLMSTSERYRQGISVTTTTPAGDIRSGVDHVLFGCMGLSHYGQIKIIYKDSAYLRRDVLLTNRDFGPQQTRYPSYRKYHNSMRSKASTKSYEENTNTNPYESLSPRARQAHINAIAQGKDPSTLNAGNNEWNIAYQVPVEDWHEILVNDQHSKDEIDETLDRLLREGRISEKPEVVVVNTQTSWNGGGAAAKRVSRLPAGQSTFSGPPLPERVGK